MARILIVDDDKDIVEACRLFLEREGHTVAAAYSRGGGMRAVSDWPPDLLILDVMMDEPDDGIRMAQELRRSGWQTPIVMLTSIGKVTGLGYSADPDVLPVDAFLEKPVRPAVLLETVAALLARSGGKEESHAGHGTAPAAR